MATPPGHFKLRLSPNVRVRMTIAEEMRLDPNDEVFNDTLHDKYAAMHREALAQQQGALRSVIMADAGLALILFGKNVTIPGTGLGIQDIPAATEFLTVVATFGFLTLATAFLNAQMYQAILEQFYIKRAAKYGIDPDFISCANIFNQVYLKAFRPKMNIHGIDFFEPEAPYRSFYGAMTAMLVLSWLSVLIFHIVVVGFGVWNSVGPHWIWWLFASAITLIHVVGLASNLLPDFSFLVRMTRDEVTTDRSNKMGSQ